MQCPRCNNEWDVSKSPCSRCGLRVHLPDSFRRAARTSQTDQRSQPLSNDTSSLLQEKPVRSQLAEQNVPAPGFADIKMSAPAIASSIEERTALNMPLSASSIARPQPGTDILSSSQSSTPTVTGPMGAPPPGSGYRQGTNGEKQSENNAQSASFFSRSQAALPALRPSRLVTDAGIGKAVRSGTNWPAANFEAANVAEASEQGLPTIAPGTLLRSGRYRLQEIQKRQDWLPGIYEVWWMAQDAQRGGAQVMLCEVVTTERNSMQIQSMLRTATMALTSISRHLRVPTLWDAFGERGRNFFVFESLDGETLLTRMHLSGRAVPEQDIIDCGLQITELLDLLAQQSPPVVHGLIRPEHIVFSRQRRQYALTHFSIILAGGGTQFVLGTDRLSLSPYTAPEFSRGVINSGSDLYALLASMYHAVTGSIPASVGGSIPQAQHLNPNTSHQLNDILTRGLHFDIKQRYQYPSELRRDLLSIRSVSGSLSLQESAIRLEQAQQPVQVQTSQLAVDSVSQVLPDILAAGLDDDPEQKRLLPRPEELPALKMGGEIGFAFFWIVILLAFLSLVVFLSRGLM